MAGAKNFSPLRFADGETICMARVGRRGAVHEPPLPPERRRKKIDTTQEK
ncbi:hypothetical protein EPICR_170030 [Candidatus Desulfarcum epimagneticum]|uniref:Uncharacterized protein n=1 Tax=uncultured Desulfobacteraceae bacterium TaxID=218296 RepID=A0A484HGB6_9BACT|nr:hypothetical protein EPICR_170030 [uncultured Desulfobacteraceae bacterium]